MSDYPELRLTRLIREKTQRSQQTPGSEAISLNQLLQEVNTAAAKAGHPPVTYRMLKRLRQGDPSLGLTQPMLLALADYWPETKQLPAFVMPGVYEALVGPSKVVFMLGAKPRTEERRIDISHWDVLAHAELLTRCSGLPGQRQFEVRHVLWHTLTDPKSIAREDWYGVLEDDGTSIVSIGSPLVSLTTEVMLARMMGVEPFVAPHFKFGTQVPFFFAWRAGAADGKFCSAFGLSADGLKDINPNIAAQVRRNSASAFVLDGVAHCVAARDKSWIMHGIIAAQRRSKHSVWLVVSGLAGPATYAAALKVKDMVTELPWSSDKDPSKILWVPVKVRVCTRSDARHGGDIREIETPDFDGVERLWPS